MFQIFEGWQQQLYIVCETRIDADPCKAGKKRFTNGFSVTSVPLNSELL